MEKIGVFAGSFDPIHLGHTGYIEKIIKSKKLDKVYLLIEKAPKHKKIYADYIDRKNMIEIAISTNPKIEIYECAYEQFPISNCLPNIKLDNPKASLCLLIGSDVAEHINTWEGSDNLLKNVEITIADRDGQDSISRVTSGKIRARVLRNEAPSGLDKRVYEYILSNEIY